MTEHAGAVLHTARLPFLAIDLLGLRDRAHWPGLLLEELRPAPQALPSSWPRSPFRPCAVYATAAQLEQMRVACEQIERAGAPRAAHPEREILKGLRAARPVTVVPESAFRWNQVPHAEDDEQDTEPAHEPLVQSALSAVWFSPLPDAVPDSAPLRPKDPAGVMSAEEAWRGELPADLLPLARQCVRVQEARRQERRAKKQARQEQIERQGYAKIRRSLLP